MAVSNANLRQPFFCKEASKNVKALLIIFPESYGRKDR